MSYIFVALGGGLGAVARVYHRDNGKKLAALLG